MGLLILLTLLTSCSAVSRIASLSDKAALATKKVDASNRAILAKVASYQAQIQYDLSQPNPEKTIPVALQLTSLSLALTGQPSETEKTLEAQVITLLSSQKANQDLIQRLQVDGQTLVQQNVNLVKDRDIKSAQLSTAATVIAGQADMFSKLKWYAVGLIVFVIAMILLRIFFSMTVTGAQIAAKIP